MILNEAMTNVVGDSLDSRIRLPGFQCLNLLAVFLWVFHSFSGLSFLICKMGLVMVSTSKGNCEDEINVTLACKGWEQCLEHSMCSKPALLLSDLCF